MKNSIEIKNLNKTYPKFKLKDITLNIPKGVIVGLIGENGAGKTTLIKSILDIIHPETGTINVCDKDEIGVVLDGSFFPEILKVKDILPIMRGVYKSFDPNLFNKYLTDFKLDLNQDIKTLSKGMQKKLEIATALAHSPKLLILDEPTSGLDPVVRSEILDIFLDFIQNEEHSILLSTHITSDLEHVADYIVLMDSGEIIFNKTRDEVLDDFGMLKCDELTFKSLDKEDIVKYKKNKFNYEVLVTCKSKMKKKYKDCIIDSVSIEDVMLLYIKGE